MRANFAAFFEDVDIFRGEFGFGAAGFVRFDEIIAPLLSDEPKPDERLESKEQKSRINEAVARLPDKQRTVFVLRYYENLPYDEIAKLLGRSVGGMKANYFQAVQKISRYLKESQ